MNEYKDLFQLGMLGHIQLRTDLLIKEYVETNSLFVFCDPFTSMA